MREFLRLFVQNQLARAERLMKAWPSPADVDVYVYTGQRDQFGFPLGSEKLQPAPPPPVRDQLRSFWMKTSGREPGMKFDDSTRVRTSDIIQLVEFERPSESRTKN